MSMFTDEELFRPTLCVHVGSIELSLYVEPSNAFLNSSEFVLRDYCFCLEFFQKYNKLSKYLDGIKQF